MLLSFAFQNECIESPGTVQRIFSFSFSFLKGVCCDTRLTQNYRALFSLGMQWEQDAIKIAFCTTFIQSPYSILCVNPWLAKKGIPLWEIIVVRNYYSAVHLENNASLGIHTTIENSGQYLLFRTDVLQEQSLGAPDITMSSGLKTTEYNSEPTMVTWRLFDRFVV